MLHIVTVTCGTLAGLTRSWRDIQQGRVALGKWCIGPQKGYLRTPGMDFFCTVPRPHFLGRALIWPGCFGEHILGLFELSRNFVGAIRTTTINCRGSFIDLYLVFPRNSRIVFLTHTNTVMLLEPYCGTITEPGLPVIHGGEKRL